MRNLTLLLSCLLLAAALGACRPPVQTEGLRDPEKVQLFTVPLTALATREPGEKPPVMDGFPFLAPNPVGSIRGKLPPAVYAELGKLPYRARELSEVDFWRLKQDPTLCDLIYLKGMLLSEFKPRGNGLLESIAFSYNIPADHLAILRGWIAGGGVLWLEPSIAVSAYDYKFKRMDDARLKSLVQTLSGMTLEGHRLEVETLRAKRTDALHVEPLRREFTFAAGEKPGELDPINTGVKSLLLTQSDYIGLYLNVKGTPIIRSGGKIYASYLTVGRGKIITLAPFDFQDSYYDGELFRILLVAWAMDGKH